MSEHHSGLKLGVFLQANGNHLAAWRHPQGWDDIASDVRRYHAMAREAEAAGFDLLFLADTLGFTFGGGLTTRLESSGRVIGYEPLTLLANLAAVTEHIGLVGTVSTSFTEPYNVARQFASLDIVSGGRSGWNMVTSGSDTEARNFSRERHLDHGLRYERAREFVQVVKGLWRSWEPGSFIRDKQAGRFFDISRCHPLDHHGKHFSVQGPLNIAPSPQGAPVVFQAGGSDTGLALAAHTAEVVFAACRGVEDAQDYSLRLRALLRAAGRADGELKIMPGLVPIVDITREKAMRKHEQLQALISPQTALEELQLLLPGVSLDTRDPDAPFPLDLTLTNASQSRQALIVKMSDNGHRSILEVAREVAAYRGHWLMVGSVEEVVDQMEAAFRCGAVDGFNIMPAYLPDGLVDFRQLITPELRRRGLIPEQPVAGTLRARLGLPQ
ncbi:LLM class flavin-dependent oxidoreductase [Pseudomonas typographi]|uniref:LLM class flavin-dependent oxidoreductase n=1 Tax=Pseudomonas typographi TaxID=2715964 RepID=UPI001689DBDF|nr:LLM class flavin-dependent oxidoreductase [Pseudomonas typographi]MBD1586868.1 LLM class flavin-dependent oxidoreductase [Pseudomonas typographi]